jgi:hypothetical protein
LANKTIPLYSHDGALVQWVDQKRLDQLVSRGQIARTVARKGHVNRAVLHRLAGDSKAITLRDYVGTKYSFQQRLSDGHRCYRLRALGDNPRADERNLAPEEVRSIFAGVLMDRLVIDNGRAA